MGVQRRVMVAQRRGIGSQRRGTGSERRGMGSVFTGSCEVQLLPHRCSPNQSGDLILHHLRYSRLNQRWGWGWPLIVT